MTTRDTVEDYFDRLSRHGDWQDLLSDSMTFTVLASPVEHVTDRNAWLERLTRFYSMATAVEVRDIIVDGDKACALARYELRSPAGPAFESHVAEVFEVRNGRIESFGIYFDTAPFPK